MALTFDLCWPFIDGYSLFVGAVNDGYHEENELNKEHHASFSELPEALKFTQDPIIKSALNKKLSDSSNEMKDNKSSSNGIAHHIAAADDITNNTQAPVVGEDIKDSLADVKL